MTETHDSSQNPPERLSAAQAVAAGVDFAELDVSSAGLFWNEYRPEDGACRIWHWRDGQARCLTPSGFSVRSRVYEYGGGAFWLNLLLTLCGYIPGIVHAVYIIAKR